MCPTVIPLRQWPEFCAFFPQQFESEWPTWYGPGGQGNALQDLAAFANLAGNIPVGVIAIDGADSPIGIAALKGGVVRMHTDRLSFAAGTEMFTAEFFLDRYSPGRCEWRARNIDVSVSRPGQCDSWQSFAWVDYRFGIGTPELEEVIYICKLPTPTSTTVSCNGPTARISTDPGQIRASFVVEPGARKR